MTITILPPARTQFFDSNGNPLVAGQIFMYVPNSSTFKTTWQDAGGAIPNANPIILDGSGECLLWGSGQYRQVVQDSLGNTIWDQITEDPGFAVAASFGGTSTTAVAIGTGTKTFTTQPGLQFFPGATVNIASNASALNYMNGTIASYNTTTGVLVVTVLTDGGSGTYSDWNIAVSGVQGPAGTVTAVSVATNNGFAGTSSGGGTPQLTLSTTVNGVVKGNGTALSQAVIGTDYSGGTGGLTTGIVKTTTSTGALSIAVAGDFPTLNQNTTGNAATVTTNANLTGPVTSVGNATTISNGVVTEAMLNFSNNTTANVSISAHGLMPILPNNASLFANGVGGYSTPISTSFIATSTTSLLIGTGSKTYTTQSGLSITPGQYLITSSMANSANYMYGVITSYTGTTLVLNISSVGGSGTFADWSISLSGPPGAAGSVATSGSPTTGNLAKFSNSTTITNADLTGDITTSGGVATTLATVNGNVGTFVSTTVNGKGLVTAAGNLTGDITSSGAATTLATVNANTGTFASVTVNGKGLATAAAALSGDITTSGSVSTLATVNTNVGAFSSVTVNGKGLVTSATNLSGDVISAGSIATLATVNTNVGSFTAANITVNAKGLITAASNGSAGAMSLISTQTISTSTASVTFSSGINSTYTRYILDISNLSISLNNTAAQVQFFANGGFSGASYGGFGQNTIPSAVNFGVASGAELQMSGVMSNSGTHAFRLEFTKPDLALPLNFTWDGSYIDASSNVTGIKGGGQSAGGNFATTQVKFFLSGGNILTGTFKLYGIT